MSDEAAPCDAPEARRMSERELLEAAKLLREATHYVRRACQLMQYTEEGETLGIMLYQYSMPINAAECVLMGRARRMRAAETRQKLDDYYTKLREKGNQVTFSIIDEWMPESAEEASKSTDQ